jgi:alanine dehydrogenase
MKRTPPALLLDRPTIASLLSLDDCIAAVEGAFIAHARGETLPPGLLHGDGVGGEYHIKAGGLRGPRAYYACKVNSSFFSNRATNGLPNIQGLILLYDAADGRPLAVMESAARLLARRGARTAAIVGAGTQAAVQLEALTRVCALESATVWARDLARAEAFAARMSEKLGLAVRAAADLATATRERDIVVTCTPSKRWVLGRDMVSPGALVAAVGADSPDKQEIEPALLARSTVITDLTAQCIHVGDLHHAIVAGLMQPAEVRGEIGQVLAGQVTGRKTDDEIIVYDATGTALQDVAAAAVVYERAVAGGRGTPFAFWG